MLRRTLTALALALCASAASDLPDAAVQAQSETNLAGMGTNSVAGVDREYQQLLEMDDAAQADVDRWIQDNQAFVAQGAGVSDRELNQRIRERFDSVKKGYEGFIARNPKHTKALIAYASFLGDLGDEEGAQLNLEKALTIDQSDPAIYNNLANIYGHIGPVKKAFDYYAKAIELNPREPVYYHNFGTTVYLYRRDAREHYEINEEQVFAKAFSLYSNAMRLDPLNFPLASDVAQTWYGVVPLQTENALNAWTNAMQIARDDIEREGVHAHFARVKLLSGRFDEARAHLGTITNAMYAELKRRLVRSLNEREEASKTNAPDVRPGTGRP